LAARLAMAGEKLLKAKREEIVCVLDSVALDGAKAGRSAETLAS